MTATRRSPVGAECQCANCGLFFSSESAFEKHWTKDGHADPREVGLIERVNARGVVWGWPGGDGGWVQERRESVNGTAGIIPTAPPDRTTGEGENGAPRINDSVYVEPCRSPRTVNGHCAEVLGRPCVGPCVVGAFKAPNKPAREPEPARGPNGGVLAVCSACGREWERPKQRGRPSFRCPECRDFPPRTTIVPALNETDEQAAARARKEGHSWEDIGALFNMSKQAAQQRFG